MNRRLSVAYLVFAIPWMLIVCVTLATTVGSNPDQVQGPWKPSPMQNTLSNASFTLYAIHYLLLVLTFSIKPLEAITKYIYILGAAAMSGVFIYNDQVPPDAGPFDLLVFIVLSVFIMYMAAIELLLVYGIWSSSRRRASMKVD
jgi:hypothetical protein